MATRRNKTQSSPNAWPSASDNEDDFDDDHDDDPLNDDVYANALDYKSIRLPRSKRISEFCEKDTETFIFSKPAAGDPKHEYEIILDHDNPTWADPKEKYTCQVISVKKEKAMLGMKTNLVYQLIPTFSNIQVSRKISQFEWLSQKLSCKFSTAFLPPLPDKRAIQQCADSKDDETECKRQLLQRWVNKISTHPVLSQSSVFRDLFLSTTDAKRYSDSKKSIDKDQYVGGKFFYLIKAPKVNKETCEVTLDQFVLFSKKMESSCAIFEDMSASFLKSHAISVEKQHAKTSNAFVSLAQTFELNTLDRSNELTVLYRAAGKLYDDSAMLFRKKCVRATKSLLSIIREYNAILKNVPDIMLIQKTATQKASSKKGNLSEQEEREMNDRVNVVTATLAAEVAHFHKERIEDFNDILMEYLKDQLEYHEEVSKQIKGILGTMKVKSSRSRIKV